MLAFWRFRQWLAAPVALLPLLAVDPAFSQPGDANSFFESRIRPLLASRCSACHTQTALGDLRMDSRESLLRGGKSGPAIVPGRPDDSLLIQSVSGRHKRLKMPMSGAPLTTKEIADLREWVESGAVWPKAPQKAIGAAEGVKSYWAFQPVRKPERPAVRNEAWVRTAVDRFILAKLDERRLEPVDPASKRDLIRRATFDLIGLPPTPADVEAFLNDTSSDAFARVVDRLLASPHYGERWGRHWLDVVRYADADQRNAAEQSHVNAWRYRDWVVEAFNRDLPYDQFVKAQLGADLLPGKKDLPALGFLSVGVWGYFLDLPYVELRAAEIEDRIDVIGRSFLGMTIACARCHDHKYDPISQRDYYALAGIIASSEYREYPLVGESVVRDYDHQQKKISELKGAIQNFTDEERRKLVDSLVLQTSSYMRGAWRLLRGGEKLDPAKVAAEEGLSAETLRRWVRYLGEKSRKHSHLDAWDQLMAQSGTSEQVRGAAEEFQKRVEAIYAEKKQLDEENTGIRKRSLEERKGAGVAKTLKPGGVVHYDTCSYCELNNKAMEPAKYYFWKELFESPFRAPGDKRVVFDYRGDQSLTFLTADKKSRLDALKADLKKLEDAAPEDYPFVMGMADSNPPTNVRLNIRGNVRNLGDEVRRSLPGILNGGKTVPVLNGSGRLQLAEAIAAHPLAARVLVNRIWMHHFGRGIVDSPSNFGQISEPPTHPELLDYLAGRFRESGWSIKSMHREIMLSATYQLSTRYSPNNAAVDAGNQLYWRANRRRLDAESIRDSLLFVAGGLELEPGGEAEELSPEHNRRTLYAWISRKKPDGLLTLFDFPDPSLSNERRNSTNVPLQGLFFLNSPLIAQHAELLSKRLASTGESDESRIRSAFLLLYGRPPSSAEVSTGLDFLAKAGADASGPPAWAQYAQALLSAGEFYFMN